MNNTPLKIYFAGDLFDAKDLGGNLLLSRAIGQVSGGRYAAMLPQDGECEIMERTSKSIRDADFELLLQCDIILANFDGHDLDSGTVVEFCFAKMADIPAVLLRTDFRNSGDHTLPDGEPWNLMCSHYPRTNVLHINSMEHYHRIRTKGGSSADFPVEEFYCSIAESIVQQLDDVAAQPAWLEKADVFAQYKRVLKSAGGSLSERFPDARLQEIVSAKIAKGIY